MKRLTADSLHITTLCFMRRELQPLFRGSSLGTHCAGGSCLKGVDLTSDREPHGASCGFLPVFFAQTPAASALPLTKFTPLGSCFPGVFLEAGASKASRSRTGAPERGVDGLFFTSCKIIALLVVVLVSTPAFSQDTPAPASLSAPAAGESQSPAADPVARVPKTKVPPKVVIPFPLEAYRVIVEIGFDGKSIPLPAVRRSLLDQIRKGLDRMYGSAWDTQVRESDWLVPGGKQRLLRLTAEELLARYPESTAQKVLLIGIEETNGTFQISCREYDTRVQEMSPVLDEQSAEERNVSNIACRLIRDSFRPVLLFAKPTPVGGELEFLLQGGELTVPDPSAAFIRDGDVLRTFLRQMDRRNPDKLKSLTRLDLCYVRVTGFNDELRADTENSEDLPVNVEGFTRDSAAVYHDSGHVRGVLISHGPVPYGGAGRSVQQIALRQRPAATTSHVKLVLQARPDRPLICYRVDQVAKLRHTDTNEIPGVRVLTDRNGELEIAVDPLNPTFWLYVYSGSSLLARVPYAPGLLPMDTIKLPDDGLRLGVEGELYLFRDALVDTVAQKAVLTSLAKKAAANAQPEELEKFILQLDELPGQKEFMSRLNAIKTPATQKAVQQRNTSVKRKIEKLCLAMEESLTKFYSSDNKIREAQELEQLRKTAKMQPAATVTPGLVPLE